MDLGLSKGFDVASLVPIFAAIAAMATIFTLGSFYVERDTIRGRMKAVALERDKIRSREREKYTSNMNRKRLRHEPKQGLKQIVDQLQLEKHLGAESAKEKLKMAGYRGQSHQYFYLLSRLILPILFAILTFAYLTLTSDGKVAGIAIMAMTFVAAMVGLYLPVVLLSNMVQKRQQSIKRAFPDTLDLLLICVEAGMSIEVAFRKVSQEIATQSIALAEEMTLTTAELSYLSDRRLAYENLANRTGIDSVKAVCMALIQAEKYGTGLSQTLRVMAQESRDMRMIEAEKKAAALPPKLTVPMIVFFLPVLFVVILGPAAIKVMQMQN